MSVRATARLCHVLGEQVRRPVETRSSHQKQNGYTKEHIHQNNTAIIFTVHFHAWFQEVDVRTPHRGYGNRYHYRLAKRWSRTQQPRRINNISFFSVTIEHKVDRFADWTVQQR